MFLSCFSSSLTVFCSLSHVSVSVNFSQILLSLSVYFFFLSLLFCFVFSLFSSTSISLSQSLSFSWPTITHITWVCVVSLSDSQDPEGRAWVEVAHRPTDRAGPFRMGAKALAVLGDYGFILGVLTQRKTKWRNKQIHEWMNSWLLKTESSKAPYWMMIACSRFTAIQLVQLWRSLSLCKCHRCC